MDGAFYRLPRVLYHSLMRILLPILLLVALIPLCAEEKPQTFPGKGLMMTPGQFAEYRSLVAVDGRTNEIMRTRFLVLEEKPEHPGLTPVAVLSFARDKLVNRQLLYYDLKREPSIRSEDGDL